MVHDHSIAMSLPSARLTPSIEQVELPFAVLAEEASKSSIEAVAGVRRLDLLAAAAHPAAPYWRMRTESEVKILTVSTNRAAVDIGEAHR
jgi:hypothetical protein